MAFRLLVLVLASLGFLAACGGSSTDAADHSGPGTMASATAAGAPVRPATALGPCRLLTSADVQAINLQYMHYPGKVTKTLDLGTSCDYGGAVLTVVDRDVSRASFEYGATRHLSGLGLQALYGADYHWLRVRTPQSRFEVRCILCDTHTEVASMTTVARKVLTHVS